MADTMVPATFSRLPVEMKTNIFAFVRENSTKAAACLVNREWRNVMAPMLFETLTLQKRTNTPQMMAILLDPENRITPHVHGLFIARGRWEVHHGSIIDPLIPLVIGALPQDCLHALAGDYENTIDTAILVCLLQHQARLKHLVIRHETRPSAPIIDSRNWTFSLWAASRCANIESLTVFLRDGSLDTYTSAGAFVRNALHLKALRIKDFGHNNRRTTPLMCRVRLLGVPTYNVFGGPFENEGGRAKFELSRMSLEQMDLGAGSTDLIRKHVKLSKLKCLQMVLCEKSHLLLTALAPACNLTELIITMYRNHPPQEQDPQAVEGPLNSFSGLRVLWLDLDGRMVSISCIVHHGSSLRKLGIHAGMPYLPVDDLEKLLQSTPQLEGLAIDLCPALLGKAEHVISNFKLASTPGKAYAASELETYLTTISVHPRLKYLRTFTPPTIEYLYRYYPGNTPTFEHKLHEDDFEITRTVMQHFATQILAYLSTLGSRVQFWGIMPNTFWRSLANADANGHEWPRYYYARRRVVVGGEGGEGDTRVVAVPTSLIDGLLDDIVFMQVFNMYR